MAPTAPDRPRRRRSWFAILWACVWGGVTLSVLFVAVAQWTGLDPQPDDEAALGAVMVALFTGAIGSAGVIMARVARRTEGVRPGVAISLEPTKRNRLPRAKSTARQPMVDLAEAEAGLAELLRQLSDLPGGLAVPFHVIEHTWCTASDTADQLRSVAARLEAVELAMRHAPPREWAALEDGVGTLRLHLDQGLDAYRTLIGATGRVVLAGAPVVASTELTEATESLAGLAEALRELSQGDDHRS